MDLSKIIRPEHSFVGLQAATKGRALEIIAEKAARAFGIDGQSLRRSLETREHLGSTGCGNGIAIPHAAVDGMTSPQGLLLRFYHALDFQAVDDIPIDIGVVLLFGEANRGEYLNVLASIARRLWSDQIVKAMRAARTAEEMYATFIREGSQ